MILRRKLYDLNDLQNTPNPVLTKTWSAFAKVLDSRNEYPI